MATRLLRTGRTTAQPLAALPTELAADAGGGAPSYVIAGEPDSRGPLIQKLIPAWDGPLNRAGWPSTVVSWGYGRAWTANLLLPGHRDLIPVDVETGWVPTSRVPRSVHINGPAELLRQATLTECPGITDGDAIAASLIRRSSRRATALIYLLTGGRAWRSAEIDTLNQLRAAGVPLWVGLDKLPGEVDSAEFVAARSADVPATYLVPTPTEDGRTSLATGLCALLLADPVEAPEPSQPTPWRRLPVPMQAMRGRLRRFRLRSDPVAGGEERPAAMAVRTGAPWPEALEQAIASARTTLAEAVDAGLADVHQHCVAALADKTAELAATVDLSLHAAAMQVTEAWQRARFDIYERLLSQLLAEPPTVEAHRRLAAAQARSATHGLRPYTLLVTATAGVAMVTDEPDAAPREPFVGLDIALSDAGYAHLVGRLPSERKDALIWLERATVAVAEVLAGMVGRELEELQFALGVAANEAVDHGLLLM